MISKFQLHQIKNRNSKKDGTLRKLKRPPKWLFPLNPERGYTASLYSFTFEIRKVISSVLLPKIPFWLSGATIHNPDPIEITQNELIQSQALSRADSLIDDIINDLNSSLLIVDQLLFPFQQRAITSSHFFALEIAAFNRLQYDKNINSVLGVDIFVEEPWLESQLELFANQNAQLITNMKENEIERVSGIIQRGLQEGSSYDSIAENIEKSFGITRRHAKLIARDQTAKLNGSLTKLRQQNAGVSEYIWETSMDERVRPDHRVLQGKRCRWDDPTVYFDTATKKWEKRSKIKGTEVHPSQDVNCRCQPTIFYESVFEGF